MKHFRFTLTCETPDGKIHRRAFIVDSEIPTPFKSYDFCPDPAIARMVGGISSTARIDTDRERLARQISTEVTEGILTSVKSQDTKNGYPQ